MNDFEMTLHILNKCTRVCDCLDGKIYNKQRYPQFRISEARKTVRGNRFILKLWTQQSGEGLLALHTCDNAKCLNPAHLYWGDHRQNALDSVERNSHRNARKTHCKNGHPFSGKNLRVQKMGNKIGRRYCRACESIIRSKKCGTTNQTAEKK